MAPGNLAAARGAAARRGKSPISEVDVRPDFHPVGTATEGSTLVRDLTRPLKDSLRSRPVRAGARRSRASGAEATKRPKLNPRPPKPMRGRCSFGIYVREMTALIGIGRYGKGNNTANISSGLEFAP